MDQRLSLMPEERDDLRTLAKAMDLTINRTIARAVDALAYLHERNATTAARFADGGVDADVIDLFNRVARLMPARLVDDKVEWGRLSDQRPALIIREEWVVADDGTGELIAVRRDGAQVGLLARGDIQPVGEPDLAGDVQPLQEPAQKQAV